MKISIFALFALIIVSNLYAQEKADLKLELDKKEPIFAQDLLYRPSDKIELPKDLLYGPDQQDFKIILIDKKKEEPKKAEVKPEVKKENDIKTESYVDDQGHLIQKSVKTVAKIDKEGKIRLVLINERKLDLAGVDSSERNCNESKQGSYAPVIEESNMAGFSVQF